MLAYRVEMSVTRTLTRYYGVREILFDCIGGQRLSFGVSARWQL